MAVQYAVAHSSTIFGVGSIAGPAWGCANGRLSQAVNECMCSSHTPAPRISLALTLASSDRQEIDPLIDGKPKAFTHAYVFQSAKDCTVKKQPAQSGIEFLKAFVRGTVVVDRGNPTDGSDQARHGIISPDGVDQCRSSEQGETYVRDKTYVLKCGTEDNAGELFHALYGGSRPYDPSKRDRIPERGVLEFDQQKIINAVKDRAGLIAWDFLGGHTDRRKNFDMAKTGYLYVPPNCDDHGKCRVHIALHGCRQNAKDFAETAGYNNWAKHYHVIVVYPALEPQIPWNGNACSPPGILLNVDFLPYESNYNTCWDW